MRWLRTGLVLALTTAGSIQLLLPRRVKMGLLEVARAPVLNDVSTDLDDPPSFVRARHGPLPEAWKPRIRAAYGDLAGLLIRVPGAAASDTSTDSGGAVWSKAATLVQEAVLAVAKAMPRWEVVLTQSESNELRMEAVATTRLMRFRDDVVIRLRPAPAPAAAGGPADEGGAAGSSGGAAVRVDVRSRSRVGKGDLGANAARIRAFMEQLRAEAGRRGMKVV